MSGVDAGRGPAASYGFDGVAPRYDRTRGGEERGRKVAARLVPFLRPGAPVLDVGTGTGVVGRALTDLGHTVYGLDLSPAMLVRARQRLGPVVVAADAARLPFRASTVEQAVSVWVLQMVADAPAVLAEVARVLVPGGRYVIASGVLLPADDPIGIVYEEVWRSLDVDGRRDDRSARLRLLAPEAGFTVEHTGRFEPTYHRQSPAEAAAFLESGAPFFLWALDAAERRRAIGPAVARLRAMPDPDRPRTRRTQRELVVLRRIPRTRAPHRSDRRQTAGGADA
ncbi:class I SAM-dependent methyltransferase [Streptomyces naphthomycinicus]|uniref:class I SAM-dependent methyltransferase n=1 Tax=Streptomyces naphthomycinicus TaxID=2872625 RepID=UPI001CED7B29|nr:methyltransferase domain-containing protein [Streptomyces sp. TML10]